MTLLHGKNYGRPTLDLNFAENKSLIDTVTGKNLITFSRSQSGKEATYVGSDGLIKYAGADEPRFDYDPETGESLGLLIEESRTNLAIYSEYYKGAWIIQTGASVIPNQAIAPNGEKTASLFKGTGNISNGVFHPNRTVSGSSNNTKSIYLRSVSGTSTAQLKDPNSTQTIITCNLTTEWQRFILTETQSGGSAGIWIDKIPTEGIYVWGAQLEQGSFPTSYIPTSGSTVTRNADTVSITGTNFSSWYNNNEGTFFTDMAYGFTQDAGSPLRFGGVIYNTVSGQVRTLANTPSIMGGLSNSQTVPSKTAVALKSQDFRVYRDGTQTGSNTSLSYTPTGTQLLINSFNGSKGHIARFTYWPKRLPDLELQQLTK